MNKIIKTAAEGLKIKIMSDFKDIRKERGKHADSIIQNHIIFSMGAGIIPMPIVDVLAVSASQLDMIRQLCKVYDIDFAETQGKAIVSSLTTATLARIGAGSLAKMIPIVGSIVGGITNAALSGASTYALGQVFKAHFDTGGTFLDFDTDRLKKMYKEQFEKGKQVAEELRQQKEAQKKATQQAATEAEVEKMTETVPSIKPDVLSKLKELGDLKANGIITEEEFDRMKKRMLEGV